MGVLLTQAVGLGFVISPLWGSKHWHVQEEGAGFMPALIVSRFEFNKKGLGRWLARFLLHQSLEGKTYECYILPS